MALMDGPDVAGAAREAPFGCSGPEGRSRSASSILLRHARALRGCGARTGRENGIDGRPLFRRGPFTERWRFSQDPGVGRYRAFEVPRFPRRLETYLGSLLAAGFRLTGLKEPRPSDAMADTHPWPRRWREHGAIFLYRCRPRSRRSEPSTWRPAKAPVASVEYVAVRSGSRRGRPVRPRCTEIHEARERRIARSRGETPRRRCVTRGPR